jgi:hypothetical protein
MLGCHGRHGLPVQEQTDQETGEGARGSTLVSLSYFNSVD